MNFELNVRNKSLDTYTIPIWMHKNVENESFNRIKQRQIEKHRQVLFQSN